MDINGSVMGVAILGATNQIFSATESDRYTVAETMNDCTGQKSVPVVVIVTEFTPSITPSDSQTICFGSKY